MLLTYLYPELLIHLLFVYLDLAFPPRVQQLEKTIQSPLSTPVPKGQRDARD